MDLFRLATVLLIAVGLATVFGPAVYLGLVLGMLVDRLLIIPAARTLARHDRQ